MNGAFLQTSAWEQVHQSLGRKTWRVRGVLVIRHNLPGGYNYLYCARPDFGDCSLAEFVGEIAVIAREEHSIFLKVDPIRPVSLEGIHATLTKSLQPAKTTVIDLRKSEEELLAGMHEKTRYNIRLAERKGVSIRMHIGREAKDEVPMFLELLKQTAGHQHFSLHEERYYALLADMHANSISNELFFAETDSMRVAGAMINFLRTEGDTKGGCATYLHGGSAREHRELMAPHLMHWRIIQEAKQRGFYFYDFWGIDEVLWPGLTRFKLGFGGEVIEYPPGVDVIFHPFWYSVYRLAKKIKYKR